MSFKVALFVLFETGIKPLMVGILIDIFTLPLFPGASIQSRIAYSTFAPFSSIFQHWLFGNIFLVQCVHSLADIRAFLRPGALWYLQKFVDPAGQSVREMINKPVSWHLAKYLLNCVSGVWALWVLVGLTLDVNNAITRNFAPLRWNLRSVQFT